MMTASGLDPICFQKVERILEQAAWHLDQEMGCSHNQADRLWPPWSDQADSVPFFLAGIGKAFPRLGSHNEPALKNYLLPGSPQDGAAHGQHVGAQRHTLDERRFSILANARRFCDPGCGIAIR